MRRSIIFDIDGTLADLTHRLKYIKKPPKDWESFFAGIPDDKPIRHNMALVMSLRKDFNIIFASGRPERTRESTVQWLRSYGMYTGSEPLYMRADEDRREDTVVKSELLVKMIDDGHKILMAFDDRNQVVQMWRACGIPCMQVKEGNY